MQGALLESFKVAGFRRLLDVSINLGPLNVLIGANGSGKTSFCDAIRLVRASLTENFPNAISDFGGINEIITRESDSNLRFELVLLNNKTSESCNFLLSIKPQLLTHSYAIEKESLLLTTGEKQYEVVDATFGKGVIDSSFDDSAPFDQKFVNRFEVHSSTPITIYAYSKLNLELIKHFHMLEYYSQLDVSDKSPVKLPQLIVPDPNPGKNGENLVSCLFNLREQDRDRFELLEDSIRAGFNDFERLGFESVGASQVVLNWKDNRFEKPFYLTQLSSGMIRFLWLLSILIRRNPPPLILIDEPETSFHPELFGLIVDLMREASIHSQIIVATQSDRLVQHLKPEEVIAVDMEDGYSKLTRGDEMDLEKWLVDYTLDDLWRMGILGARS